jgi:hypothetical protein
MFQVLAPGYRLPDPEFFFPHGHTAIAKAPGVSDQESGKAFGGFIAIVLKLIHYNSSLSPIIA